MCKVQQEQTEEMEQEVEMRHNEVIRCQGEKMMNLPFLRDFFPPNLKTPLWGFRLSAGSRQAMDFCLSGGVDHLGVLPILVSFSFWGLLPL